MPGFGYTPDSVDPRDSVVEDLLGVIAPPRGTVGPTYEIPVLQVFNQGMSNGCVGFAIAGAVRARWARLAIERGLPITPATIPAPSALWLWWQARHLAGSQDANEGCQIRDAFKRAVRLGICPEDNWPSIHAAQAYGTPPDQRAYRQAWDQRTKVGTPVSYYRFTQTGSELQDAIKAALGSGFPVVFGAPVDKAFQALRGHVVAPDHDPEKFVGFHAMYAVGWNRDGLRVINSWGPGWGNGGSCVIPWSGLSRFIDIWAVQAPPTIGAKR